MEPSYLYRKHFARHYGDTKRERPSSFPRFKSWIMFISLYELHKPVKSICIDEIIHSLIHSAHIYWAPKIYVATLGSRKVNITHVSQAPGQCWGHTNDNGHIFRVRVSAIQRALPAPCPPTPCSNQILTQFASRSFQRWPTCTHKAGCKPQLDCNIFHNLPTQLCTLSSPTLDVHYLRNFVKKLFKYLWLVPTAKKMLLSMPGC